MKEYTSNDFYHDCERLVDWFNEGKFITVFDAYIRYGGDFDTHYSNVFLIGTDYGTYDLTKLVSLLLRVKTSNRYGKNGVILYHGSIFDMVREIILKLQEIGYVVNVDTTAGHDTEINNAFRWL